MGADWEQRYNAGDTPWDKGMPSPGLIDWLEDSGPVSGRVLVPGCGFGHDVRALSHPGNEVVGLDIAPSAVRGAGAFPKTGNETYRVGDICALPADLAGGFDWLWEHTCFCAIHPSLREGYIAGASAALKSGGRFLGIFYVNPDHGGDEPPYRVSVAEIDDYFGERFVPEREWLPAKAYPGRENREWMRLMRRR